VRQIDVSIWGRVFFCRVRPFIPFANVGVACVALHEGHSARILRLASSRLIIIESFSGRLGSRPAQSS
jgi:hypothetical protein